MMSSSVPPRTTVAAQILTVLLAGASTCPAFTMQDVVARARALAAKPYQAPPTIPDALQNLTYDQYQSIRFKPERSLWRESHGNFEVAFMSPGLYYTHAVKMNVVDAAGVHAVPYDKDSFTYPSAAVAAKVPADLGFAGFKLTYPLNGPQQHDQFLVFAGASYFRGVGTDNVFGLSGRGIAVDTGLPSGEQFPVFTEFWLVRPSPDAHAVEFYALLEGQSLTGAYHFVAYPDTPTVLQVHAELFFRSDVELLGLAPLTSMFYYGENTVRPVAEWRPQVHDSDGLLVHDAATGEWLWRPLLNPLQLEMDDFETRRLGGFGLLQRQRRFSEYEDAGALYERRPSAWVEPVGNWGKGSVTLVQLPAPNENSDNMVAFWTPATAPAAGSSLKVSYRVGFGWDAMTGEPMGRARQTFVGSGNVVGGGDVAGAYRVVVDFVGGPLAGLAEDAAVQAVVTPEQGGKVIHQGVTYLAACGCWRLSMLVAPASGSPLVLRAYLKNGGDTLTETWTYRLPANNRISPGS